MHQLITLRVGGAAFAMYAEELDRGALESTQLGQTILLVVGGAAGDGAALTVDIDRIAAATGQQSVIPRDPACFPGMLAYLRDPSKGAEMGRGADRAAWATHVAYWLGGVQDSPLLRCQGLALRSAAEVFWAAQRQSVPVPTRQEVAAAAAVPVGAMQCNEAIDAIQDMVRVRILEHCGFAALLTGFGLEADQLLRAVRASADAWVSKVQP